MTLRVGALDGLPSCKAYVHPIDSRRKQAVSSGAQGRTNCQGQSKLKAYLLPGSSGCSSLVLVVPASISGAAG